MARSTRPNTANSHPGKAHNRYSQTRRSSDEVRAEKLAAEAKKADAEAKKEAVVNRIVQLENDSQNLVKEKDIKANHPKNKVAVPRQSRIKKTPVEGQFLGLLLKYADYSRT